jgi:hypothetical protein
MRGSITERNLGCGRCVTVRAKKLCAHLAALFLWLVPASTRGPICVPPRSLYTTRCGLHHELELARSLHDVVTRTSCTSKIREPVSSLRCARHIERARDYARFVMRLRERPPHRHRCEVRISPRSRHDDRVTTIAPRRSCHDDHVTMIVRHPATELDSHRR